MLVGLMVGASVGAIVVLQVVAVESESFLNPSRHAQIVFPATREQ
jgi:hypothetical protein